jgi:uncharacterized membrane protein
LLEKIFRVKLWDYSYQRFNIKGRISLAVSVVWFFLILFQVFVLQEKILLAINQFSEIFRIILATGLLIYFLIDSFFSAKMFYYFSKLKREFGKIDLEKLNKRFNKKIKSIKNKIKISPVFKRNINKDIQEFIEKFSKK